MTPTIHERMAASDSVGRPMHVTTNDLPVYSHDFRICSVTKNGHVHPL
jgi:hypothetical protein